MKTTASIIALLFSIQLFSQNLHQDLLDYAEKCYNDSTISAVQERIDFGEWAVLNNYNVTKSNVEELSHYYLDGYDAKRNKIQSSVKYKIVYEHAIPTFEGYCQFIRNRYKN